jgi:hypothetical protein
VHQQVERNRHHARELSRRHFEQTHTADGVTKRAPKSLQPGQLVAIRRRPRTHLGVTSVGPFLVTHVGHHHITVRSLTTGRSF